MNSKHIILPIVACLLVTGCDRSRTKLRYATPLTPATAVPASLPAPRPVLPLYTREVPAAATYTPGRFPTGIKAGSDLISKNDLLEITVFKVPDLTRELRVGNNGSITFPLIGGVHAHGLTPAQLESQIEKRLGKDFLNNPQVTVVVKESTQNRVTVEGAVKTPGIFPVSGSMTVLQAIALAGGLDTRADPRRAVLLRRNSRNQISQQPIDIAAIRQGRMQDLMLLQDDRIVIPEGTFNRFTVSGAVNSPGVFQLQQGMTFLQAVAMAGGLTDIADRRQAILFRRDYTGNFRRYIIDLKAIVEGGAADPEIGEDDRIVLIDHKTRKLLREAKEYFSISPVSLF
ncbi:MAG: SLBB domain-containing protein [Thiolinea sp.]